MAVEKLEIRNYNPASDYPQVKHVLEQGGLFYGEMEDPEKLEEKIGRDSESIMVATMGDQIVGTVSFMEDGRMPLIFRLAVEEGERRKGIGEKLMQEAEKRLKSRGYQEIHLLVNEEHKDIRAYYRKRGYQEGNLYRWMFKEVK